MQCVILAAGKGTRMLPITLTTPKPLVFVLGKPIIEHVIEALPQSITELIIVVGYRSDDLKKYLGEVYKGLPVSYVHQPELLGTAHALHLCKDILKSRFLIMAADDIHGTEALQKLVSFDSALAVSPSEHPERFGVVATDSNGYVTEIIEKPARPQTNLVSTGAMVLNKDIFLYSGPLHTTGEYYLPDILTEYAKTHPIQAVIQNMWIPIGYPEDIKTAEVRLRLSN